MKGYNILHEYDSKTLLKPSWLSTYEEEIEAIWHELVTLNTYLHILEEIESFPFDLFFVHPSTSSPFWWAVQKALLETSVMIVWKIVVDSDGDSLTLKQLKNRIVSNWREDQQKEKEEFLRDLKLLNFEQSVKSLEGRIREVRHKYIAHFSRTWNLNPQPDQASVDLVDLKQLLETSNSLFDLLCFSHKRGLSFWGVEDDIQALFDSIIKNSIYLNLPEKDPITWNAFREKLSPNEMQLLNENRRKFNLPEV